MPTSRPKILVVEDDTQLAHLYCTSLALRGMACVRAADGISALRSIEQGRPSLILLDLNLPTVNGWTVLRELAENPLTNDIPVIVVTGVDPPPQLSHALVVLCKPCDPDHVAKIVTDHLPAHRQLTLTRSVEPHRLAILPRPTILIADDHSDFRDALTVLLEHEGYRVADANNGAEALAYLRSGAPVNALIVDLDMPVMNGWDFIAACRANATWRTIPTLVVTGVSIADRSRAEVADNTTIVTKPFNFDDLVANLRRVMIREVPKPNVG